MKKISVLLLALFVCQFFIYAETREEQIPISFASDVASVAGFSGSAVNTIGKVTNISKPREFDYDSNSRTYIVREPIYAYVQIFTTAPIEVRLQLTPLIAQNNKDVKLQWSTSNTLPYYDSGLVQTGTKVLSSEDGAVVIFKDGESNVPRPRSWLISPVLTAEEVNEKAGNEDVFEASMIISLYAI